MAKFIQFHKLEGVELPPEDGTEGQILRYLLNKYPDGYAERYMVMNELNSHQTDGVVVKKPLKRPLSQLFDFFKTDWTKKGFMTQHSAKLVEPKQPGKMAKIVEYVQLLQNIIKNTGLQVPPFDLGEYQPKTEPEKKAA